MPEDGLPLRRDHPPDPTAAASWSRWALVALIVVALAVVVTITTMILEEDERVPTPAPIELPATVPQERR